MAKTRFVPALLAVVAVLAGGQAAWGQTSGSASTIFINEFHYDNLGGDVNEAIEVALPTGTDITNLSVVLYNGSGGMAYGTMTGASGTLTAGTQGYSFLVFNYPSNGIQNGSPDGIALVNGTTLIQFLSYEGAFTGVGGVADGVVSTDIGVSETGSTASGSSLQLSGTGTTYGDFTWQGEQLSTFGAANTNQVFVVAPVPEPATILGLSAAALGAFRLVRRRVIG